MRAAPALTMGMFIFPMACRTAFVIVPTDKKMTVTACRARRTEASSSVSHWGNMSIVTGFASTVRPTAQGTAITKAMRAALTDRLRVSLRSPEAWAVAIFGMIAAETAVATETGMLMMTTALLEKRPKTVVTAASDSFLPSISILR